MAALTPVFRSETERIHAYHAEILEKLDSMEALLERLETSGCTPAGDLVQSALKQVAQRLATELPAHCQEEERELHSTVAGISTELAAFAAEMKRQHAELQGLLNAFLGNMQRCEADSPAVLEEWIAGGRQLARKLRAHIELEERELKGFL
jgi:hemerythrin-like domain-containing protein